MSGSDPNKSRAFGQTADRPGFEAEEDPLVELARIVSEDGGFGPRVDKPKPAPPEPVQRSVVSGGLEAELLQEFESSFAARESAAPSPAPPPARSIPEPTPVRVTPFRAAPDPAEARDERDADELLRSIEEQLGQFERRQAARFASTASGFEAASDAENEAEREPEPEARWDSPAEVGAEAPSAVAPPEPEPERDMWTSRPVSRIRSLPPAEPADDPAPIPQPIWPAPGAQPVAASSEYRFRGPAAAAEWEPPSPVSEEPEAVVPEPPEPPRVDNYRRDEGAFQFAGEQTPADLFAKQPSSAAPRPTGSIRNIFGEDDPPIATQPESAPPTSRRDRLAAAFPEFEDLAPAEAESRIAELPTRESTPAREPAPDYPEAAPAMAWQSTRSQEPDESKGASAIAPSPSRRAAAARTAAAARRSRSRVAMTTLAGVVVIVLVGGVAAFYLRAIEQVPSQPPPVIAAPSEPVRIDAAPEQASNEGQAAGDAVYNGIAGNQPPAQEQVVEGAEEPRELAQVVLPPPQADSDAVVKPVGGDETAPADASASPTDADATTTAGAGATATPAPATETTSDEVGPRRVPTFVVRSDGTIVTTQEAGPAPSASPTTDQQIAALETEEIKPVPVPTVAISDTPPSASGTPTETAPTTTGETLPAPAVSVSPTPAPTPPATAEAVPVDEGMVPRPSIEEPVIAAAELQPAPTPPPPAASTNSPVNLLANAPAAETAAPAPAPAAGGYVVQISAQRSMDQAQASFADLQRKFTTVLGSLTPQIQVANLGEKGTYYRVRVGPWATRDDAVTVCEALKAAGGDCLVAAQ